MQENVATTKGWATWSDARALVATPRNLKRTTTIAMTVGTIFFTMNQLGTVLSGKASGVVWMKVALTYLTPLIVSNLGMLSATRRVTERPAREQKRRRARRLLAHAAILGAMVAMTVALPAAAKSGHLSSVNRFMDGSPIVGAWSTLATSEQGAKMTLQTSELTPGNSVTVWWVIFNEPTNCKDAHHGFACGPADLPPFGGDDSAVTSVVYAAGHQIGGSGRATFSGALATGDTDGALFGPGLVNPTGAEIHLVVRDHGDLTPQQQAEGIHSFGPCNPCADIQFSAHVQ
jgi:hypothetical protein